MGWFSSQHPKTQNLEPLKLQHQQVHRTSLAHLEHLGHNIITDNNIFLQI